jgi:O-antigen ligase
MTRSEEEFAVVATGHLEQPIMSSVLLVLLWNFRNVLQHRWSRWCIYFLCSLTIIDILGLVQGRTGYITLLIFFSIEAYRLLPNRIKFMALALPVVLSIGFYSAVPRFHDRVNLAVSDVYNYSQGDINSSQGLRIEMWHRAWLGIQESPLLGHGVGSYPEVYKLEGGLSEMNMSQPHQQYLLWWNDSGIIGLLLILGILIAFIHDSRALPPLARNALISIVSMAAVVGLFNCPFFGVGLGEYFIVCLGTLLAMRYESSSN